MFRKHSQADLDDIRNELKIHVRIYGDEAPAGRFAQRLLDAFDYLSTPDAWFDEMSGEVGAQADLLDSAWMDIAASGEVGKTTVELIPLKFLDSRVFNLHPSHEGPYGEQYTVWYTAEDITNEQRS